MKPSTLNALLIKTPSLAILKNTKLPDEILELQLEDGVAMTVRGSNCTKRHGVNTIKDFVSMDISRIFNIPMLGVKTIEQICRDILLLDLERAGNIKTENKSAQDNVLKWQAGMTAVGKMKCSDLILPPKLMKVLDKRGLKTVKAVRDYVTAHGTGGLRTSRSGAKNFAIFSNVLESTINIYQMLEKTTFKCALDYIFAKSREKELETVKKRFGFETGEWRTLEEIGQEMSVTRERVRQIAGTWIARTLKWKGNLMFKLITDQAENLLLELCNPASVNEFKKYSFFSDGSDNELGFMFKVLAEALPDRFRLVGGKFLAAMDADELLACDDKISDVAHNVPLPASEEVFYEKVLEELASPNSYSQPDLFNEACNAGIDYISHTLNKENGLQIKDGVVYAVSKLTIIAKVALLLERSEQPMHYIDIAKAYNELYGENIASRPSRLIHSKLTCSKRFLNTGGGIYMLRKKFRLPGNLSEIVGACIEILKRLNAFSDTKKLVHILKKRGIDIGALTHYTLKPLLIEQGDFIGGRKFEIGLRELQDSKSYQQKKSRVQELQCILENSPYPITVDQIFEITAKNHGWDKHAIYNTLVNEAVFIGLGQGLYCLSRHIDYFDEIAVKVKEIASWQAKGGNKDRIAKSMMIAVT